MVKKKRRKKMTGGTKTESLIDKISRTIRAGYFQKEDVKSRLLRVEK